jgi:hypothetical protein
MGIMLGFVPQPNLQDLLQDLLNPTYKSGDRTENLPIMTVDSAFNQYSIILI